MMEDQRPMTDPTRSVLVISPDKQVSDAIGKALAALPGLRVDVEPTTLTGMNGRASKVASTYDVVLFQTAPGDGEEIDAIEALSASRRPGTVLLALADSGIPLSQARALNRAGVDEVLPLSGLAADVSDQISRIGRSHSSDRLKTGRLIVVAQARGGIGATTIAVNLADQLAYRRGLWGKETRRPVALVDLDLQFGTTGSVLDLPEQDTLHQIASEAIVPDAVFLKQSMQVTNHGLSVLAAPAKFAPIDALRPEQVAAILDTLRQTHDYVVVDLPRVLVNWIEPVLQRADRLLVVSDLSVPAIRHCRRLIDFFAADNATLAVEVVVNRERRGIFGSAVQREAEKALERKLDHWVPDNPRVARLAADRGMPLSSVAASSSLCRAVGQIAEATLKSLPVIAHATAR